VETYPLGSRERFWHSARDLFLRANKRFKDGKEHRYYTVVESRRLSSGKVAQKQVLYLGEINDSQQAAWRRRWRFSTSRSSATRR
jgi:hypothetical protein